MSVINKLNKFVDATVMLDEDNAEKIFSKFITEKMSSIVQEFTEDNPIKLRGDDVYVNNKLVGTVEVDINDMDSGIDFVSVDKKYSKEFDNIEGLYTYLAKMFNVSESEKNAEKALKKQDAKRAERMKRWADAKKKKKNVDGTDGEYEKNDLVKKHKRPKGG